MAQKGEYHDVVTVATGSIPVSDPSDESGFIGIKIDQMSEDIRDQLVFTADWVGDAGVCSVDIRPWLYFPEFPENHRIFPGALITLTNPDGCIAGAGAVSDPMSVGGATKVWPQVVAQSGTFTSVNIYVGSAEQVRRGM